MNPKKCIHDSYCETYTGMLYITDIKIFVSLIPCQTHRKKEKALLKFIVFPPL